MQPSAAPPPVPSPAQIDLPPPTPLRRGERPKQSVTPAALRLAPLRRAWLVHGRGRTGRRRGEARRGGAAAGARGWTCSAAALEDPGPPGGGRARTSEAPRIVGAPLAKGRFSALPYATHLPWALRSCTRPLLKRRWLATLGAKAPPPKLGGGRRCKGSHFGTDPWPGLLQIPSLPFHAPAPPPPPRPPPLPGVDAALGLAHCTQQPSPCK